MCFSMASSVVAGAILTTAGGYMMHYVGNTSRLRFLASIPLFFGVQQLCEAVVWFSQGQLGYDFLGIIAAYLFLFFAFIWWPSWMPFSLWFAQENKSRLCHLRTLWIVGSVVSIIGIALIAVAPMSVSVVNCSIMYRFDTQLLAQFYPLYVVGYAVAVIVPFFVSSLPYAKVLGVAVTLGMAAAYAFWYYTFISVWCFFAALVSFFIFLVIRGRR
jgi:hypothetical protein